MCMSFLLGQDACMARISDTSGFCKDYLLNFKVTASASFPLGFWVCLGFFVVVVVVVVWVGVVQPFF